MTDPETAELEREQRRRERFEGAAASEETDPEAARQHARRAERAAYLRDRLAERAEAEDGDG